MDEQAGCGVAACGGADAGRGDDLASTEASTQQELFDADELPPLPPKLRREPQERQIGPNKLYADRAVWKADHEKWEQEKVDRRMKVKKREKAQEQRRDRSSRQRDKPGGETDSERRVRQCLETEREQRAAITAVWKDREAADRVARELEQCRLERADERLIAQILDDVHLLYHLERAANKHDRKVSTQLAVAEAATRTIGPYYLGAQACLLLQVFGDHVQVRVRLHFRPPAAVVLDGPELRVSMRYNNPYGRDRLAKHAMASYDIRSCYGVYLFFGWVNGAPAYYRATFHRFWLRQPRSFLQDHMAIEIPHEHPHLPDWIKGYGSWCHEWMMPWFPRCLMTNTDDRPWMLRTVAHPPIPLLLWAEGAWHVDIYPHIDARSLVETFIDDRLMKHCPGDWYLRNPSCGQLRNPVLRCPSQVILKGNPYEWNPYVTNLPLYYKDHMGDLLPWMVRGPEMVDEPCSWKKLGQIKVRGFNTQDGRFARGLEEIEAILEGVIAPVVNSHFAEGSRGSFLTRCCKTCGDRGY